MLPQFELEVRELAEQGQLPEAITKIKRAPHLTEVRKGWLLATCLMLGSAQDRLEAIEQLAGVVNHRWAHAEPDTLALTALELSMYGLKMNRKAELEEARALVVRLEGLHGEDSETMQWIARTWINIGNRFMQEGKLEEAGDAFQHVMADSHPDNWCTRFSALLMLAQVAALKGDPRHDLIDAAIALVPGDRRAEGFGQAAIALTGAFVAYANKETGRAIRLAEKARKKAAATAALYSQAYADLLLLRIAVESGVQADPPLLARLREWGGTLLFVPFLASKLMLQGKEGRSCAVAVAQR